MKTTNMGSLYKLTYQLTMRNTDKEKEIKQYTSVVISCPGIALDESYTLKAGTSETTVTMDSLIYGTGNTMGR